MEQCQGILGFPLPLWGDTVASFQKILPLQTISQSPAGPGVAGLMGFQQDGQRHTVCGAGMAGQATLHFIASAMGNLSWMHITHPWVGWGNQTQALWIQDKTPLQPEL